MPPYEYIDHEADIGILGIGNSIEEAFEQGAKAMFNIMVDIDKIKSLKEVNVECSAQNIESLFVEWLNSLLSKKDIEEMFFSKFKIEKIEKNENFKLIGTAFGEKMDLKKHNVKIEVKAATYSGLKFEEKTEEGIKKYYIQCIVDV